MMNNTTYFESETRPADVIIKVITPEVAKKMLGSNFGKQRKLKRASIDKFVEDIRAGRWNPYRGDLLRVSDKGTLIDGQHRLWACIEANEPIAVLYKEGFDEDEFVYLDSGKSRTRADALGGKKNADSVASLIRWILAYQVYGLDRYRLQKSSPSNAETSANYRPEYSDYITLGGKLAKANVSAGKVAYAFFFWLADQVDNSLSEEMKNDLLDELIHRTTISTFRSTISRRKDQKRSLPPLELLAMLVDMWNAYTSGKEIKTFRNTDGLGKLQMIGLNVGTAAYPLSDYGDMEEA